MSLDNVKKDLNSCGKKFFIDNFYEIKKFQNGEISRVELDQLIRGKESWIDIKSLNTRVSKVKMIFERNQELEALKLSIESNVEDDFKDIALELFKTETGRPYDENIDKIVVEKEKILYPQILEVLDSDLIKDLCALDEFKFQKGVDKLIEFENYNDLTNDEINETLNKFKDSGNTYTIYIENLEKNSKEYHLLRLAGQVISYCDKNAANKNDFNEYTDKRTIAKSGVWQNEWIDKLLKYKTSNNAIDNLTSSIKNAVIYLKDPETGLTMLSENHREMVSLYLLKDENYNTQTIVNDIISFFEPYEINVFNEKNRTAVYCSILYYFEDVRKLWFEHIEGLVVCDNTGWIDDAINDLENFEKIVLWWDKSPSGGKNVVKLLEANFKDSEKPYFYVYYSVNQKITYRARIVDFANSKNYEEKNWNKNDNVNWYNDKFSEYHGPLTDGKTKKAKVVFLSDKIEKLRSPFGIKEFIFFKNLKPPTQNNMQPYVEISQRPNYDNVKINDMKIPLNQIFYGPPGTGKTYNISSEAEKIININNKRANTREEKFNIICESVRNISGLEIKANSLYRNERAILWMFGYLLESPHDVTNSIINSEAIENGMDSSPSSWAQYSQYLTQFGFVEDWRKSTEVKLNERGIDLKNDVIDFLNENNLSFDDLKNWSQDAPSIVREAYFSAISEMSKDDFTNQMKAIYCILNLVLNNGLRSEVEYKKKEVVDRAEASLYIDIEDDNSDIKWIGQIGRSLNGLGIVDDYIQDSEGKNTYYLSEIGNKLVDKIIENWERNYPGLFGEFLSYGNAVEHGRVKFITFHQSYSYEEFIEGIRPKMDSQELTYSLEKGVFKEISDNAKNYPDHNYVIIIDEINRGNISKIFGELITLIEPTKRLFSDNPNEHPKEVTLPYSKKLFGVPKNLYILGTMNTADKSIALLDSALRRRFSFTEMLPKSNILTRERIKVEGIKIEKLLDKINQRIEFLIDKDHTIGHSYFLKIKDNQTIEALALIFKKEVIPLLMEYFYGDFEKIRFVLGDNKDWKEGRKEKFFKKILAQQKSLFGKDEIVDGYDEKVIFELDDDLLGINEDGSLKGKPEDLVKLFKSVYDPKSN